MSMSLSVELAPEAFQGHLANHRLAVYPDIYFHLGEFAFNRYADAEPRLRTAGVEHGFNVIGRLMRIAATLYSDYCKDEKRAKSVEDLRRILLDSKYTPGKFADIPSEANSELEAQFGVFEGKSQVSADTYRELFQFASTGNGSIHFVPVEPTFSEAKYSIVNNMPDGTLPTVCPMQELTQEEIWPDMVSLAAETPQAFAHSLGLNNQKQ